MDDFPTSNFISDKVQDDIPQNVYSDSLKPTFLSITRGKGDSFSEYYSEFQLENGKETDYELCEYDDNPSETLTVCQNIKLPVDVSNKKIPEGSKQETAAANANAEIRSSDDELMVESYQLPISMPLNQDSVSAKVSSVPANTNGSTGSESMFERSTLGSSASKQAGNDMASGQDISVAKTDWFTSVGTSSTLIPEKGKGIASEMDHGSDSDEYPDLLVADPDTNSNHDE